MIGVVIRVSDKEIVFGQQLFDLSGELSVGGAKGVRKKTVKEKPAEKSTSPVKTSFSSSYIEEYIRFKPTQVLWVTRWPGGIYDETLLKKWYDTGKWETGDGHFNYIAPCWKENGKSFDEVLAIFRELKEEQFKFAAKTLEQSYYDNLKWFKDALKRPEGPYGVQHDEKSPDEWFRESLEHFSRSLDEANTYRKFLGMPLLSPDPVFMFTPDKARIWGLGQSFLDEMRRHQEMVDKLHSLLKSPGHYKVQSERKEKRRRKRSRVVTDEVQKADDKTEGEE